MGRRRRSSEEVKVRTKMRMCEEWQKEGVKGG